MQTGTLFALLASCSHLCVAIPAMALQEPHLTQVEKRASGTITTQVTATHLPGSGENITPIQIDGKTYNVLLDTGSNELWVKGHGSGKEFSVTYGSGTKVSGNIVTGDVTVGGITLRGQSYGLADDFQHGEYAYDGILGLGSSATQFSSQISSWMNNAMPLLQQPVIGVKMVEGGTSVFDFGFIDAAYEKSSPLYLPSDRSSGKWSIDITRFGVPHGDTSDHCILDTGTTFSFIPESAAAGYWSQVAGAKSSNGQEWSFPCSQAVPEFKPQAGGSDLPTSGSNFKSSGNSQCSSLLIGSDGTCIFGQNFLYGQYAVFDWGNQTVGLAIQQ